MSKNNKSFNLREMIFSVINRANKAEKNINERDREAKDFIQQTQKDIDDELKKFKRK